MSAIIQKEQLRVHVRWMINRDMPEVLYIEEQSFEHKMGKDDFLRCLNQSNCIGTVAELDDKVVGFIIYEFHNTNLHILDFVVHPDYRRKGVGRQMVEKLISKLSNECRTNITLVIRERNLKAQLFFKNQGFLAVYILPCFYENNGEDGFLMQYQLNLDSI